METIIAAMIGLVGVFLGVLGFWIRSGFQDQRAGMSAGFAAADKRFDKVDAVLKEHGTALRLQGERIARMEGALAAHGLPAPLLEAAVESAGAETAATG